jgi:hypothetical protein
MGASIRAFGADGKVGRIKTSPAERAEGGHEVVEGALPAH